MKTIFNALPIRKKIASIIVFTTSAVLLLATLIFAAHSYSYIKKSLTKELSILAATIGYNTTAAIAFNDPKAAKKNLQAFQANPVITKAIIYLPEGKIFARYHSQSAEDLLSASSQNDHVNDPLLLPAASLIEKDGLHVFHRDHLDTFMPIQLDAETIGYIGIRKELNSLNRSLLWSMGIYGFFVIVMTCAAYFFSVRMSKAISDPIIKLLQTMQIIAKEKNYSVRAQKLNQDETGSLIDGFNDMLGRIEKRDEALYFTQFSVDHAGVAVLWLDATGKLIYINEAAVKDLGYSREELLTLSAPDFCVGFSKSGWQNHWQELQEKKYITIETEYIRRDGTTFPVEISTNHVHFHGKEFNFSFAVDISDKKDMEQELQVAEKMKAIGSLTAGVAHDLNNILCGLVGFPELLLAELPENDPKRKTLKIIKDSGESAAAIVQDLLTLARRGLAPTKVINLNTCLSEYLSSHVHQNLIANAGANIKTIVNKDPDLPNIRGASSHISKTIMNLSLNAFESMPHGGVLKFSTSVRCVKQEILGTERIPEGEYVLFSVEDTGSGINDEDLHKIFEPFFSKKKLGRSGTGLGMTVVWSTVKDSNGFIDVTSREGVGSCFQLYFPVCQEDIAAPETPKNIEDYRGSETIVVVDDLYEQREIASRMLGKLGYTVVMLESGESAIEYMKANNADLLILDMIMEPGIDGMETYKRIIDFRPKQKAIIASGYSESERVLGAKKLGVGTYVKKPYSLEKLVVAVRTELDK